MPEEGRSLMAIVGLRYKRTHTLLLDLAGELSDEELRWRPQAAGNSVAWMLWHLGRFADGFQAEIVHAHEELVDRLGATDQVWFAERIAARWGLEAAKLGPTESGMGMRSGDALDMRLPAKEALLNYVRRCFALADRAVDAIDDGHLIMAYASEYRTEPVTIGETILAHLGHERYHLGQMRYLQKMMRRISCGTSSVRNKSRAEQVPHESLCPKF